MKLLEWFQEETKLSTALRICGVCHLTLMIHLCAWSNKLFNDYYISYPDSENFFFRYQ